MTNIHLRFFARAAAASLLGLFTGLAAPAALGDEPVRKVAPDGLACVYEMETEPYTDDLEPTAVADTVDPLVCDIDTTPIAT